MRKYHTFLICGENNVGKTTASLILKEMTNYPVFNFADSLKEFMTKYWEEDSDWLADRNNKENVRHLMVKTANHFKSVFGKDFFAREVYRRMGEANRCIIGDLRFEEELDFIRENFLTYDIIYITKDIHQSPTKLFPFLESSEDNYEYINIVENNGTLEELREKLSKLFDINKYKCTPL